jgi:hypothetical protein
MLQNAMKCAAAALPLAAAACAPESATTTGPQSNSEAIQQALTEARAGGASEHQIEVLEHALDVGEVTYDDLDSLASDVYACFDAAGLTYVVLPPAEVTPHSGIVVPAYAYRFPDGGQDDGSELVADPCEDQSLRYAETAYMNQPAVIAAVNGVWDTPEVRACLTERGYAVDEDATSAEIQALIAQDATEHGQDPGYPGLCGT